MWGHFIKLQSPDKRNEVAFLITSENKMSSVSACMAKVDFMDRFRDWNLMEFKVKAAEPEVDVQETMKVDPPVLGSTINITV